MAGPANLKKVEFAPKPEKPAERVYAKSDVRHARIFGGMVGFFIGLVTMFFVIWYVNATTTQATVDTFGRGVAIGKAVGDGH